MHVAQKSRTGSNAIWQADLHARGTRAAKDDGSSVSDISPSSIELPLREMGGQRGSVRVKQKVLPAGQGVRNQPFDVSRMHRS